ncbi:ParB family protein [Cryobacterium sp. 10C2]|uniref:ParB family protein n=1 Tax=Cryobacterium sp. 10C2 TaxID=3048576 RepID=UPI003A0FC580
MSDDTPSRQIGGLAHRAGTPDLSRLQARNRTEPTVQPVQQPKLSKPAAAPARKAALMAEPTARMTTYLSAQTRDRARATYRATSHLEGDKSWSDFVERAIQAEVERRELLHNAGEPYEGDSSPLPVGRPLS